MMARQLAIAFAAFVGTWIATYLVAHWLFGSANVLIWVIAAGAGVAAYLLVQWRDRSRHVGHTD